ncbi:MAG: hypothetical protein EON95_12145 [Caulobacteraceae bacterium]|nr:MAG: hypothetical protein EON95_12145 [Caulobacteraceae bacterium]
MEGRDEFGNGRRPAGGPRPRKRPAASHAIAHHLGLPPPETSSGPGSDAFIGHPKHDRLHARAPRIGSSHNIPSRLITVAAEAGMLDLPPTVVLVRDPREALASYYAKWVDIYGLGTFSEFLRRPAPGRKKVDDVWWFVRFFNRWGALAQALPERVLVLRHEDLKADPGAGVRRLWAHWGVTLDEADIAAAVAVSSRQAIAAKLDPTYGEAIVPSADRRAAVSWTDEDRAYLSALMRGHLRHDFGYGAH